MRDLVSGATSCPDPASSSASNPLGALANALVGSSSKTQVKLRVLHGVLFSRTLIILMK